MMSLNDGSVVKNIGDSSRRSVVQFWALMCGLTAVFISTSKGSNTLPLLCWHWMHVNSQTHSYIEKRKKEINVEKEGTYGLHFQWKLLLICWRYLLTSLKFLIDFPNIALEQSSGQCCFYCEKIKLVKIHTNHTSQKLGDMIQHVSVVNSVVLDINDRSYLQQR